MLCNSQAEHQHVLIEVIHQLVELLPGSAHGGAWLMRQVVFAQQHAQLLHCAQKERHPLCPAHGKVRCCSCRVREGAFEEPRAVELLGLNITQLAHHMLQAQVQAHITAHITRHNTHHTSQHTSHVTTHHITRHTSHVNAV